MKRGAWRHQWAELHERAQDAVIRVSELTRLGVDRTTAYRRCRPGGPWQWVLPGVVLLQTGKPTEQQRHRAAVLFAGAEAVLTGHVAARLHGLRELPRQATVPLLVPHAHQRRSAGFAVVERTRRIPPAITISALPCAPVVRAVLDAARRIRDPRAVQALIAEAVQRGYCTPRDLRAELDAGSSRGSALVRSALPPIEDGARSVAEGDALSLWREAGLPKAEWNVRVMTNDGQLIATPDAYDPLIAFAWEIDSFDYHLSASQYARTVNRNGQYAKHGIAFLQTIPSRVFTERDAVIEELCQAHAAAAGRTPPPGICYRPRDDG